MTAGATMGITLEMAAEMLAIYSAADKAIINGNTYTIGTKLVSERHLQEVHAGKEQWQAMFNRLSVVNSSTMLRKKQHHTIEKWRHTV